MAITNDGTQEMIDYDELMRMAKERGRSVAALIALSDTTDPFFTGVSGRTLAAKWFAEEYEREGFTAGVHVRRIHYRLISRKGGTLGPTGEPYENTVGCWVMLSNAARDARYLGLVSLLDFDDRRNPIVIANGIEPPDEPHLQTTGVTASGIALGALDLPQLTIAGAPLQPYHIEIWCEKSTMADIIDPIADEYNLTRSYALGETSLTQCVRLIFDRVARNGDRPVRILYISDFDPTGKSIPAAAARKMEWLIRKNDLDIDFQLIPLMLSHEQCIEYRLPRTPIKESERRLNKWTIRYGEGATELDALEAVRPGEFRRILVETIDRYYDHGLQQRWDDLAREQQTQIDEVADEYADEYADVLDRYRAERDRLAWEAADLRQRVEMVLGKMAGEIEALIPDDILDPLNEFESERMADEIADPLYDSTRSYEDQLASYLHFQGRDVAYTERRRKKMAVHARAKRAKLKAAIAAGDPEAIAAAARAKARHTISVREWRARQKK